LSGNIITARPAKQGFFPLDKQLEVWDRHWSAEVARLTVWLGGQVSYEQVAVILAEVGQIQVPKTSAWRRLQKWGQVGRALEQQQAEQANQMVTQAMVAGEVKDQERMGVSMDGAMVHLVGEGWKEFKIGCVFAIEPHSVFNPTTLEWEQIGHALCNTYTAYLGGPEGCGQYVWAEAQRRGWSRAWETQVVGDGAPWIWNLVSEHFFDSYQTVDWYHATQHLGLAAQVIYGPENSPAKAAWWNEHQRRLYQGEAKSLAQEFRNLAEGLPLGEQIQLGEQAGYFETNHRRMNYAELREDGWVIGSGMVESEAKQYKHRVSGPGMRWSRDGVERLFPVRSAVMSDTFNQFWQSVYRDPKN